MAENHFWRHDGPKPMARHAVTLGKREEMNEGRTPVPVLRRFEQMMRNVVGDEIPVCFIEDEGNISGLCESCECTQEVWSIDSTSLGMVSADPD
jgi:hypothetical protein